MAEAGTITRIKTKRYVNGDVTGSYVKDKKQVNIICCNAVVDREWVLLILS